MHAQQRAHRKGGPESGYAVDVGPHSGSGGGVGTRRGLFTIGLTVPLGRHTGASFVFRGVNEPALWDFLWTALFSLTHATLQMLAQGRYRLPPLDPRDRDTPGREGQFGDNMPGERGQSGVGVDENLGRDAIPDELFADDEEMGREPDDAAAMNHDHLGSAKKSSHRRCPDCEASVFIVSSDSSMISHVKPRGAPDGILPAQLPYSLRLDPTEVSEDVHALNRAMLALDQENPQTAFVTFTTTASEDVASVAEIATLIDAAFRDVMQAKKRTNLLESYSPSHPVRVFLQTNGHLMNLGILGTMIRCMLDIDMDLEEGDARLHSGHRTQLERLFNIEATARFKVTVPSWFTCPNDVGGANGALEYANKVYEEVRQLDRQLLEFDETRDHTQPQLLLRVTVADGWETVSTDAGCRETVLLSRPWIYALCLDDWLQSANLDLYQTLQRHDALYAEMAPVDLLRCQRNSAQVFYMDAAKTLDRYENGWGSSICNPGVHAHPGADMRRVSRWLNDAQKTPPGRALVDALKVAAEDGSLCPQISQSCVFHTCGLQSYADFHTAVEFVTLYGLQYNFDASLLGPMITCSVYTKGTQFPDDFKRLRNWLQPVFGLFGPPGKGKSALIECMMHLLGPAFKINETRSMTDMAIYQWGTPQKSNDPSIIKRSQDNTIQNLCDVQPKLVLNDSKTGTRTELVDAMMSFASKGSNSRLRTHQDTNKPMENRSYDISTQNTFMIFDSNVNREALEPQYAGQPMTVDAPFLSRFTFLQKNFQMTAFASSVQLCEQNDGTYSVHCHQLATAVLQSTFDAQAFHYRQLMIQETSREHKILQLAMSLFGPMYALLMSWYYNAERRVNCFSQCTTLLSVDVYTRVLLKVMQLNNCPALPIDDLRAQKKVMFAVTVDAILRGAYDWLKGNYQQNATIRRAMLDKDAYSNDPAVCARVALGEVPLGGICGFIENTMQQVFGSDKDERTVAWNLYNYVKRQDTYTTIFGMAPGSTPNASFRGTWAETSFMTADLSLSPEQGSLFVYLNDEQAETADVASYGQAQQPHAGKRRRVMYETTRTQEAKSRLARCLLEAGWKECDQEIPAAYSPSQKQVEDSLNVLFVNRGREPYRMKVLRESTDRPGEKEYIQSHESVPDGPLDVIFEVVTSADVRDLLEGEYHAPHAQATMEPSVVDPDIIRIRPDFMGRDMGYPMYTDNSVAKTATEIGIALMGWVAMACNNPGVQKAYNELRREKCPKRPSGHTKRLIDLPKPPYRAEIFRALLDKICPATAQLFSGALQEDIKELPPDIVMQTCFSHDSLVQADWDYCKQLRDASQSDTVLRRCPWDATVALGPSHLRHVMDVKLHSGKQRTRLFIPFIATNHGRVVGTSGTHSHELGNVIIFDRIQDGLRALEEAMRDGTTQRREFHPHTATREETVRFLNEIGWDPLWSLRQNAQVVDRVHARGVSDVCEFMTAEDLQRAAFDGCNEHEIQARRGKVGDRGRIAPAAYMTSAQGYEDHSD